MQMTSQSVYGSLDFGRVLETFKGSLPVDVTVAVLLILVGPGALCPASAAEGTHSVEPIVITGHVVDADGRSADRADVYIQRGNANTHVETKTTTNHQGVFEARVRVERERLANVRVHARSADGSQLGYFRFPWDGERTSSDSVEIQLEPIKVVQVRVIDAEGSPVPNASVGIRLDYPHAFSGATTDASGLTSIRLPKSERIEAVVAWKDHAGLDYRLYSLPRGRRADVNATRPEFPAEGEEVLTLDGASPLTVSVIDDQQQSLVGIRVYPWLLRKDSEPDSLNLSYFTPAFSQTTDSTGKATFSWIPTWQKSPITVWPTAEEFVRSRGNYDPQTGSGHLEMQLDRLVPIRGRVIDAKGQPKAGITVVARGAGYSFDAGSASTKTNDQGRYELFVPPDQIYLVVVKDQRWAATPQDGFAVLRNQPVSNKDFELRKATRVFGTLIDENTQEPIPNERVLVYQYGQDLHSLDGLELPNPENSRRYVCPMHVFNATTDDNGRFEFALGDGNFDIRPPGRRRWISLKSPARQKSKCKLQPRSRRKSN